MSALSCYQGLERIFRSIDGLRTVLLGEPTGAVDMPALYTAYARFDRPMRNVPPASNQIGMEHYFAHRLIIQWVDNPMAEMQLLTLLDAIPDAIDRDPRLGGAIVAGLARITSAESGFATIGGVLYRVVDYQCQVTEKRIT